MRISATWRSTTLRRTPSGTSRSGSASGSCHSARTSTDCYREGAIINHPFLCCLNGYGLCLRRLRRFAEAEQVLDRMLRLHPTDNQGVRFLLEEVRARKPLQDPSIPGGDRQDRR